MFERLANDQFCNENRCIVITVSSSVGHLAHLKILFDHFFFSQGRGYPDVPTRRWKLTLLVYNFSLHIAYMPLNHFVFTYLFGLSVNIYICINRFLRLLIEKLCLPTYCLVDCDPYGFDILTTYRFGSMVRFIKLFMILLFI